MPLPVADDPILEPAQIGGGNAKKLKTLPRGCRVGDNADAFFGGFRLWKASGPPMKEPAA